VWHHAPSLPVLAVDIDVCVHGRADIAMSVRSRRFGIQGTAYDVSEEVEDV